MLLCFDFLWQEFRELIFQAALYNKVYCIIVIELLDNSVILIFFVNKFNHKKDKKN